MAAIFQTSPNKCLVLCVTVVHGENIALGFWNDLFDTPDPYVKLYLPSSPNGKRKTQTISNNKDPIWNETFEFYLDPELDNVMDVTLMEDDIAFDDKVGHTVTLNLDELDLEVDGQERHLDLVFNKFSHVFMTLHVSTWREIPQGIRYSSNISLNEISFQRKRKQLIFNAMQTVLGERGPKNISEVPTVAILGSGGGFRAMTALSGTTCALKDLGILDCSMYIAGLSGSSWYISTLYSYPDWPNIHPMEVNNELRNNLAKNWKRLLFSPRWVYKRISAILTKKRRGQPVSLTDLFGFFIGDILLTNRKNAVLSDQTRTIKDGVVPMPLYACVNVKKDMSAEDFSEWVELNPYEVGMLNYGTYVTPEKFGNKYFCGVCVKEYPEFPLHYIQGICGSAFTILLQRLLDNPNEADNQIKNRQDTCDGRQITMNDHITSSATDKVDYGNTDDANSDDDSSDDDDSDDDSSDDDDTDDDSSEGEVEEEDEIDGIITEKLLPYIVNKFKFLKTRSGRAAEVHNFLRGLQLSLNTKGIIGQHANDDISVKNPITDPKRKRLMMCDAGLAFNSPYPLLLRKERQVDVILSFDYSGRSEKTTYPLFEELIKAEQWAKYHHYPFPPINHEEQYKKYGLREYYVFKDDKDPKCPIVIHFPLVNNLYHTYKAPGVPRVTLEEVKAGKLSIFEDPENNYSTFNFHYLNEPFDRLVDLASFNVKVCNDVICDVMAESVSRKRKNNKEE